MLFCIFLNRSKTLTLKTLCKTFWFHKKIKKMPPDHKEQKHWIKFVLTLLALLDKKCSMFDYYKIMQEKFTKKIHYHFPHQTWNKTIVKLSAHFNYNNCIIENQRKNYIKFHILKKKSKRLLGDNEIIYFFTNCKL